MPKNIRRFAPIILIVLVLAATFYYLNFVARAENGALTASGTVEAVEVIVAPEIGGRVAQVWVAEGEAVKAGDPLFELNTDLLETQRQQVTAALETAQSQLDSANINLNTAQIALESAKAEVTSANAAVDVATAAVGVANAGLESAQTGVDMANIQYEVELVTARLNDLPNRSVSWAQDAPTDFELPVWYFQKSESLSAAEAEVTAAQAAYEQEQASYENILADLGGADFIAAETRLAEAQATFRVAETLQDRPVDQQNKEQIDDYVATIYAAAEAELQAAQSEYDQLLSGQDAADILEARARLAVAKERYEIALDQKNALLTGTDSLSLRAAETAIRQAESGVGQAEAQIAQAEANVTQAQTRVTLAEINVSLAEVKVTQAESAVVTAEKAAAQAQANLDVIDVQLEKMIVRAASDGIVLSRNVEPGEVVQPGGVAMTLGELTDLTLTVYVPEDRYGEINLGDKVSVKVDSFPNQTFSASVTRIADEAEFTPRNVQTAEGRRSTVFAVELAVNDPDGVLKPGMPADVTFGDR